MLRFRNPLFAVLATGLAALALAATSTARAQTTFYSDPTLFHANASGLTSIDFEENAPGAFTFHGLPGSAVFSGVTFTTPNFLFTVDPAYSPSIYDMGSGDVLSAQEGGAAISLLASLPGGFTAIGSYISEFSGLPIDILLSDGEMFSITSTAVSTTPTFVGFISSVPITSLSFTSPLSTAGFGGGINLDNFEYGAAGVVPEGSSFLMLLGGLMVPAGGVLLRRRRRS